MKSIFFVSVFVLFHTYIFTQSDKSYIREFDKENIELDGNVADGEWKHFFDDGTLHVKGQFKDGKKSGKWYFYYPDGNVKSIGRYEADNEVGDWIYFDEKTGFILKDGQYSDGKMNGQWNYYDERGQYKFAILYEDDSLKEFINDNETKVKTYELKSE